MAAHDENHDYLFKIILLGDTAVGKSYLLARFTGNKFNGKATIGVEFATKDVEIDGKTIKAQIWDPSGQERFRAITPGYYRGAVGAIVVYDIADRSTFEHVERWLQELQRYADAKIVIMLVGNKSDLEDLRAVPRDEALQLAQRYDLAFIETSAKDASGVETAFMTILSEIYQLVSTKKTDEPATDGVVPGKTVTLRPNDHQEPKGKSCCS